jgi:hypothetical protein
LPAPKATAKTATTAMRPMASERVSMARLSPDLGGSAMAFFTFALRKPNGPGSASPGPPETLGAGRASPRRLRR